ncbi:cystatin-B [Misgurnus anguillicaudatus]|uniref:cystatin-B n=1 Tax=Misgurnus anguillicaudatus TaxID=75329 RepID=UPI003CCF8DB3
MSGSWSDEKQATPEIQKICDQIKADTEKAVGQKFSAFIAKRFTEQFSSGKQYLIKVYVGDGEHTHLKVIQCLPCDDRKMELSGFQYPKTHDDPLTPF